MPTTVIGLFETADHARQARENLLSAGFKESEVALSDEKGRSPHAEEPSFWDQVKNWLGMEDAAYYEEGARRGGTVVTVNTDEQRAEAALDIIEQHRPVDVNVEARKWQEEGWRAPASGDQSSEGEQKIPLAEEELHVGKRRVERGGGRIYTHVTEKPVEKEVELTDEHVDVERQPTDKPAGEDAFRERTIETSETHEEPVVEKEARVREELVVKKEAEKHTETVRDTVRQTEADVEGGGEQEGASRDAYQFGRELAHDARFQGQPWEAVEPEARQAFERRHIGDWSQYRETVHQGYDQSRAA
ncbi:MAG: YsnF/AvaK domain-containing protein [Phycisphaeraceae bacterium]